MLGDRDGAGRAVDPCRLVRPQVGQDPVALPRLRKVQRLQVAAPPFGDPGVHAEIVGTAPVRSQPKHRVRIAVNPPSKRVAVAVEIQVQAGARSDLEKPDRQTGHPRHLPETEVKARRTPHLVGLRCRAEPTQEPVAFSRDGYAQGRAKRLVRGIFAGRINSRERNVPAGAGQRVGPCRHPQRQSVVQRVREALPAQHDPTEGSFTVDHIDKRPQHPIREDRAEISTQIRLIQESRPDRGLDLITLSRRYHPTLTSSRISAQLKLPRLTSAGRTPSSATDTHRHAFPR
jgi:hypothetical protein